MKELIKIQAELNAPKNAYNSFGKYSYRTTESILAGLKPLLKETSCIVHLTDDIALVGDRYYVKSVATIINAEGQAVSSAAYAREDLDQKGMQGAQVTGAASSYSRKYALNGLFAIDDTKDADDESMPKAPKKPEAKVGPAITVGEGLKIGSSDGTGNYTAGNTSAITVTMDTPLTPAVANKKTVEKKLPWLNPTDTKNWDYTVKRVSEGVPVETIEGVFRLSKENRELLIKEASLKTVANAN